MYRNTSYDQYKLELPYNVKLNPESKWVKLAELIPWRLIEEEYAKSFKGSEGQIAKSSRLAFGALYIQITESLTDEKTREHIMENPHMQYFCGMMSYTPEPPFDASLMVHFRKRIPAEMIMRITEEVFAQEAFGLMDIPASEVEEENDDNDEIVEEENNRGTLILDATCCPQDIKYPTDIGLLNQSRELTEEIIDILYKSIIEKYEYKPRTYRQVARKDYLEYTKTRKPTAKFTRKHIRKQLQYVARNLGIIDNLISKGASISILNRQLQEKLEVIRTVYKQQKEMYDNKTHRCEDRIVSISQPHVRPIVRGKEHTPTEFGSKVAIGLVGGYAFITNMSWDNIPEESLLPVAAEQYKKMFGFYPKAIIGDKVYPNRVNRDWCKERNIRLSGPALGRKTQEIKQEERKQIYEDGKERNAVEGAFGTTKRKLGLDRVMAKLPDTSLTTVAMSFFVANMERKLRLLFAPILQSYLKYDYDLYSLVLFSESLHFFL